MLFYKDNNMEYLENLKKFVLENKLSLGIAYDGDGDRCLAIDEKGNEIDGDDVRKYVQPLVS